MVKETLENPRHGPYYSTALDPEGNFYGTRKAIRLKKDTSEVEIVLDKWWKYFRYKALSKVLLGGLPAHYMQGNDALEACLPTALAKKVRKGK
ncbi:hypothetical protein KEM55_004413 [Ascosphaera atra]|nr:hypothetical protein KEM55_004413 [Ascosphaera atra]